MRARLAHNEDHEFVPSGLSRQHWLTDQPVRDIVHKAFLAARLPPPNPHVIRDTLVRLGLRICSIEQFKAWSQNLGHDKVHTTLASYGTLDDHRQGELIRGIGAPESWGRVPGDGPPSPEVVRQVLDHLRAQN